MSKTAEKNKAWRKKYPNLVTRGWDERDYELWSAIRGLPSYGLIRNDIDNPMISRKEVIKLIESAAENRFDKEWRERNGESR